MVALGRLVMSTRERICAIEIEDPVPPRTHTGSRLAFGGSKTAKGL